MTPDLTHPQALALRATESTNGMLEVLRAVPVHTDADVQWIVDVGRQAKEQRQTIERERDSVIAPLKAAVATVQGWFRAPVRTLKEVESYTKEAAISFQRDREEQARAAMAIAAAQAAPERRAEEVQAAAAAIMPPAPDGLSQREHWGWEITDAAAIPRDYYVLDEARIAREARALKSTLQIPGIRAVRQTIGVFR